MKNITKPLMILSMTLMPAFSVSASTIVFDPFTDGGFTDGVDAQDVAWTSSAGSVSIGDTGTNPGSGNYLQANIGSWAYMRGSLPSDSALNIGIGETLTLSFNFVYYANVGNRDNGFRFGIFDSTGLGTVVVADTGTGGTGVEIRYDTVANTDLGGGTGGVNEFTGTSDVVSYGTMSSGLLNDLVVTCVLSITRTSATALSISASLNGGTATVTDVDDAGDPADYLTDFSGGNIVIRNSGQPGDFRVDNVEVSVAPATEVPGPVSLSDFAYNPADGSSSVSLKGAPDTRYKLVEAADLDFSSPDQDPIPLDGATVGTLDSGGVVTDSNGDATVQFQLGTGPASFLRAEGF